MTDGGICVVRDALDLAGKSRLELGQPLDIGGNAGAFHLGQQRSQGQLDLAQQSGPAATFKVGLERVREIEDSVGAHHLDVRPVFFGRSVEGELSVCCCAGLGAELAAEIPQRQVGQVERALAGQRQIGRERRVVGHAVKRPTALGESEPRSFDVVDRFRLRRVGEPVGECLVVVFGQLFRVDVGGGPVPGGQRDPDDDARAASPVPGDGDTDPVTG